MCALSSMDVFCTSLILCFPSMLLRYFLNDFDLVLGLTVNGITFVFTSHMCCILTVRSLYFKISLACFLITLFCYRCRL